MSTSIHDQELDQHFDKVETEMTQQEVSEEQPVFFRFNEEKDNPLLTWTWHGKPHRS